MDIISPDYTTSAVCGVEHFEELCRKPREDIGEVFGKIVYYDASNQVLGTTDLKVASLTTASGILDCADNIVGLLDHVYFEWGRDSGDELGEGRAPEVFDVVIRCCSAGE